MSERENHEVWGTWSRRVSPQIFCVHFVSRMNSTAPRRGSELTVRNANGPKLSVAATLKKANTYVLPKYAIHKPKAPQPAGTKASAVE